MTGKTIGVALVMLGLVVAVGGAVLMFVIVPGMKQFPEDVDTVRRYEGTMPVLLDADTMTFMSDLDVALERHFRTEETDGGVALVYEHQTLMEGEDVLQELTKHYAIDRESMLWTDDYPDDWATNAGFWPRSGLVLGWPIDSEQKDYPGWSDDYRDEVLLEFVEEQEHDRSGLTVYYYRASDPPMLIHPDHVEAVGLPLELPKDVFAALIEDADVDETLKARLPLALNFWEEDSVPLQYYYEYEGEYWIEPQTGVLIDTRKHELRKVSLGEEFLEIDILRAMMENMTDEERAASRVPVFDLTYQGTDQTVEEAKADAEDAMDQITLFGTTLPIASYVIGALLVIVGGVLSVRKPASSA